MSLYRTWRPKTFGELVGQDAVVRTLTSALETGRLSHAYLFSGPRGSGKTSAAKILARCLNCRKGITATPDNSCENCVAILNGTAIDVLELDAASNRGIDQIRDLREAVQFAPTMMRKKVYIIDEAHMLTKEGANAFLKTLEEPPEHAVFILATTEPEKLPPTILSRCQRYAFRRISVPVMIQRMREIADGEKIEIDDAALAAIAYRADGGLRDALTMLEQAAAFAQGPVTSETIDVAFGITGRAYASQILDQMLAHDASGALKTIDEASDSGADLQVLMRTLIGELRNILVARIDPDLLAQDLPADDVQSAILRAGKTTQAQVIRGVRLLTEALSTARSSGHPRLELESALLRFILIGEDTTLDALAARLSALEERRSQPAAPPDLTLELPKSAPMKKSANQSSATAASSGNASPSLQKVKSSWNAVRTRIEAEHQPLAAQLSRAVLESVDDGVVTIRLTQDYEAEILRGHQALIESALADVLGTATRVNIVGRRKSRGPNVETEVSDASAADDPVDLLQYASERIR
ncbi:MAG: DNA polymerase III subunit gamma/tau [Candidatus Eremiobacteraeota bacterium]|nr:DNA polymerase III subunit gamma/tau [Candidatus Eremiobacteraeota bacterium]